jgi:hypothetical protein
MNDYARFLIGVPVPASESPFKLSEIPRSASIQNAAHAAGFVYVQLLQALSFLAGFEP